MTKTPAAPILALGFDDGAFIAACESDNLALMRAVAEDALARYRAGYEAHKGEPRGTVFRSQMERVHEVLSELGVLTAQTQDEPESEVRV